MKRFFTLLSLILLVVGTSMAQRILSIGDEVTDGNFNTHDHYVIKLVSYNDGTSDHNVESENKYFYSTGGRLIASTINVNTAASTNFLINMQATNTEGVFTIGVGTRYIPSFTSGQNGFNCVTSRSSSDGVYGYKFNKQENGGYIMQGYRGSSGGLYLKYTGSETHVIPNKATTNAMVVKVYKVKTNVEEGKFYNLTLRQKAGGNRYVVLDNGLYINSMSAQTSNAEGVWFFEKKPEALCQWYVYNAYAGKDYPLCATTDNNSRLTLGGNGSAFTIIDGNSEYISSNGFALNLSDNATINDVSGALGIWNDNRSLTDGGSTFIATEISDAYAACTFTFTDNTNNISVVRHTYQKVGEAPTIPTIGFFTASTSNSATLTNVSADGENSYSISGTFNLPFTISKDNAESWYALKVRLKESSNRDVVVNGSNVNSRVNYSNVATTYNRFYDGLFKFIQSGKSEYFKIKTHSGNYLKFITTTGSGNVYNLRDLTTTNNEDDASNFMISHSSFSGAASSDFIITPIFSHSTSTYVVGDHNTGNLTVWTGSNTAFTDDGSRFAVKAADTTTDILTIGAKAKANDMASAAPNTYIGGYTDAAINSFKTSTYSSLSDLETKATEFTQSEDNRQKPIEGKIYRVYFTRGTQYISESNALASSNGSVYSDDSHAENRRIRLSGEINNTATLIQFEPHNSYYYIKGVNSGLYWGTEKDCNTFDPNSPTASNSPQLMAVSKSVGDTWMGHYAIDYTTSATVGTIGLKDLNIADSKGQYLFSPYETISSSATNNNNICFHAATISGTTNFEPGCAIKIQEVSTYPLTISAAGYASLCLPFSVTLPEGLTAYKVTGVADGGESRAMTMEALSGAIPAEEPIIVGGTAGTYQLTINSEDGTKSTDNILTGATVKRTGITDDYFALGYKALDASDADTKTAGFYKVTTQTMPANKAYLLRTSIPANTQQAAVLLFNFNGETTGINAAANAEAQSADNVLYDLNGRRVFYPTRGIYVKGNGKKVFIP